MAGVVCAKTDKTARGAGRHRSVGVAFAVWVMLGASASTSQAEVEAETRAAIEEATPSKETDARGPATSAVRPETSPKADEFKVVHDVRELMQRRIVKSFDFDERKHGNVEEIPMYWCRHLQAGFPHYLEGRFDYAVYHDKAPSFYLGLNGHSLGYVYTGDDIPTYGHGDYLISLWIKPDRLRYARAYASAFFCDANGRKLAGTERFSAFVGGQKDTSEWHQVTIRLAGGCSEARQIGLGVWVTQQEIGSGAEPGDDEIGRQDIHAGAWFDDINVFRLPRVHLSTGRQTNLFTADEDVVLLVEIGDSDGQSLSADLAVDSVDGKRVLTRSIGVTNGEQSAPEKIRLDSLPYGLYRAVLQTRTGDFGLSERRVTFARLGPRLNDSDVPNDGFGLVLNETDVSCLSAVEEMVGLLRMRNIKLPIAAPMLSGSAVHEARSEVPALLEKFWKDRVHVTGVLDMSNDEPDSGGGPAHASWRPLIESLVGQPDVVRPQFGVPLTCYGDFVQTWQVGRDNDETLSYDPHLGTMLPVVRREIIRLLPSANVSVPRSVIHQINGRSDNPESLSLFIPNAVKAEQIPLYIRDTCKVPLQDAQAVVQFLEQGRYERLARLCDLVRRLLWTHSSGVEVIYLSDLWDRLSTEHGGVFEPREELIVFRTIAELLNNTRFVGQLSLSEDVRCLAFDRRGVGILALWSDAGGAEGKEFLVPAGPQAEQIDIWGEVRALRNAEDRVRLRLGRVPLFLRGEESWRLKFRAGFAMEPPAIESRFQIHERVVRFVNPQDKPISGLLRLKAPPDWEVSPTRISFAIGPGQEWRSRITLRFPPNEVAGGKVLTGLFTIDAQDTTELTAQAPFALGLDDIEVHCFARIEKDTVTVHQTLTNRSGKQLDVEGYVLAPGRARMVHMYRRLEPGQTVYRKFLLERASQLMGEDVRVGLRELDGPRVLNQSLVIQ